MLKEHEIDEYIAKDGTHCPYCKISDVRGGGEKHTWSNGCIEYETSCLGCGIRWVDIYRLSEIREIK